MIVNVKANFLDYCFVCLVNVLDSCRVTREQPGDGCDCVGSDTAVNDLKEGKGWKEKGIILALEKERSLLLFVWAVFGSSRSWSCKAGQRNLSKYCPLVFPLKAAIALEVLRSLFRNSPVFWTLYQYFSKVIYLFFSLFNSSPILLIYSS